jgi:O-antigen/teichoic acid export membrane protein
LKEMKGEFIIASRVLLRRISGLSIPSEGERYRTYVGQVARGAGVSSLGQGIGRALNFATQVALARLLGPAQLGLYVLGVTTVFIANVLAQFGMDSGVVRYVAHHRAQGDDSRVKGTILLALSVSVAFSAALAALMFAGAGFLANSVYDKPSMEAVFRVFSVSLPLFTLMNMAVYTLTCFRTSGGAFKYGTSVRQIIQPAANLVLILVFYLLGAKTLGAAVAYILSMAVGSFFGLYYLRRVFPGLFARATPAKYEPRALFGVSGPMIVATFTSYINPWVAVTVLGIFSSAEAVGIYNAAARTASLSTLVLFAFTGIFSPMIASFHSRGSMEYLGRLYKDVSRWTFTGSLAVFLLTVLLAKDVMAVFGKAFIPGWTALVLIAAAYLFSSSVGHTGRLLAMTGNQRIVMFSTVGSTLFGVAANLALTPLYGFMGAATATATAVVLSNAITLVAVRRVHGFWPYDRPYIKPLTAGVIASAVTYLAKLALPLPTGIPSIIVLTPVFLAGFTAILLVLGLSDSDRQFLATLRAAFGRNLRKARTASE